MLKKLFLVMLVGLAVVFVSSDNKVEARDVYVGTSPATGWDCYAMTETFHRYDGDINYGGETAYTYTATLKMVTGSGGVRYLDYTFHIGNFPMWFENSQGYKGITSSTSTPIEWQLFLVISNYYGD